MIAYLCSSPRPSLPQVSLNDQLLPGSFKNYLSLYYGPEVVEDGTSFEF